MTSTAHHDTCFAAFIGIDWADQKHAGALCPAGGRVEAFELDQKPETIDQWAMALRRRFGGEKIAICLEQSKGSLIYALMKYDFLVLYPINPKQLAKFREAIGASEAKDDPTDASLLLELLLKHRQHLHVWQPDDELTRLIGVLVEDRRCLVDQRTSLVNALKARLKQYFPLALELIDKLHTDLACSFLLRWSSLEELQREDPQQIANFFREHHSYDPQRIAEGLQKIAEAKPLTTDPAIIQGGQMLVQGLAAQLQALIAPIQLYDQKLEHLMQRHPDAPIFQSFPGAGSALAPRLLAAFGTDRQRLANSQDVQCVSGIAPVTIKSGKSKHVRRRYACSKFLCQTFQEYARCSIGQSVWAKAYYDMQRDRGAQHQAAVRALAFKWIRILTRCWKSRTLYNELAYMSQLCKTKSPLLQYMASAS